MMPLKYISHDRDRDRDRDLVWCYTGTVWGTVACNIYIYIYIYIYIHTYIYIYISTQKKETPKRLWCSESQWKRSLCAFYVLFKSCCSNRVTDSSFCYLNRPKGVKDPFIVSALIAICICICWFRVQALHARSHVYTPQNVYMRAFWRAYLLWYQPCLLCVCERVHKYKRLSVHACICTGTQAPHPHARTHHTHTAELRTYASTGITILHRKYTYKRKRK